MESQKLLCCLLYRLKLFFLPFPLYTNRKITIQVNFPQEKLTSITSKGYRVGPCWKIRDRDGVGRSFSPGSCALSEVTSSDSTSTGEWKKPYLITVLLSFSSSFLKKVWEARRDLARFQTFRSWFAWMNSCMGFGWMIEFRGEGETKGDS